MAIPPYRGTEEKCTSISQNGLLLFLVNTSCHFMLSDTFCSSWVLTVIKQENMPFPHDQ